MAACPNLLTAVRVGSQIDSELSMASCMVEVMTVIDVTDGRHDLTIGINDKY